MARNRGRSVDDNEPVDEPIEDAYDDADLDDADLDDADLDDADLEDDLEEEEPSARRGRAAAATRERTVSRSRTKVKDGETGPGIIGRLVRRFRETVAELQKVIWPTRKELLTYTTVVVVFVTLVMSLVFGLDTGFARLMFLVFGKPDE